MKNLKLKKLNIAALAVVVVFYLFYEYAYDGGISFSGLDGVVSILRIVSVLIEIFLVFLLSSGELSFKTLAIIMCSLMMINPLSVFPAMPVILGIWGYDGLKSFDLSDKESLRRSSFFLFVFLASILFIIIEVRFEFYPLINVYSQRGFLWFVGAAVVSAAVSVVVYLALPKVKTDVEKIRSAITVLFYFFMLASALFSSRHINKAFISDNIVIVISGYMILVYKIIKPRIEKSK